MVSKVERFWIAFILRFAIGFLFLFASIEQFNHGPEKFATDLSGGFKSTWIADVRVGDFTGLDLVYQFLRAMPYVLGGLSVLILTGIALRPALRLGALLLVALGLGKYLQKDIPTTANDFLFALIICIGLYFLSLDRRTVVVESPAP
ncbi:MAG TPA: hypothetical protein VMT52_16995 [Planctomycetota bacterium]|nr:hypothetical protein [Planctomycetota bacterium]